MGNETDAGGEEESPGDTDGGTSDDAGSDTGSDSSATETAGREDAGDGTGGSDGTSTLVLVGGGLAVGGAGAGVYLFREELLRLFEQYR